MTAEQPQPQPQPDSPGSEGQQPAAPAARVDGRPDEAISAAARGALGGGMARAMSAGLRGEALTTQGVLNTVGGTRGIVETLAPGLLFLVGYTFTQDPRIAAIAPAVFAAAAIIVRLARRESPTSAFSGAIGAGIAIAATLVTGRGQDFYLPGFITNAAWSLGLLISLLVRWPILGVLYGALTGDLTGWRKNQPVRRAAQWLTVLWLGMFLARLAVQLPLYAAGAVEALGIARIVMGVPLFALVVVFTWFILNSLRQSSDDLDTEDRDDSGQNTQSA